MRAHFSFVFWNRKDRLERESPHQKIRNSHSAPCPGNIYDPNDRGQPGRFDKWYKLPDKAHKLYWRFHKRK